MKKSLPCLLAAQTQVVFNDNAAKFMLIALAQMTLPASESARVVSLLAAILVLPFVLFSPLAGWISDRFSKRTVLHWGLLFQVGVMAWLLLSLQLHSLWGAVIGFFLLALQACFFSPAKQGILKELVGSSRLGVAVGWLEMLTIVAVLVGSVCGRMMFDHWARPLHDPLHDPWAGALWTAVVLGAASLVTVVVFLGVEATPAQSSRPFRRALLWEHFAQLAELWHEKKLRLAALGVAYFWSFGGVIYLVLVQLGADLLRANVTDRDPSVILLALLGVGVAVGSLTTAAFCRRRIELGLVPVGGLGLAVSLISLGLTPWDSPPFRAGLVALGFSGGMFTVPLTAYLQDRAGDEFRGRVTAGTNLMINLGAVLAVVIQAWLGQILHLTVPQQFLVMLVPSAAVAVYVIWLLPESLLRLFILILATCVYRVRATGVENIPKGGALLICNHVSYVDTLILSVACPRPIRFIAYEGFHKKWWIGWALRTLQVIPISARHAKDAIRATAQRLKDGELVCVFPEGELTRSGPLLGLRKGFELMARQGGVPVVPVVLDSLWGSIFSFSENRYFWKWPRRFPYPAQVNFGKPIAHEEANTVTARRALLDAAEKAFQEREELKGNLGRECLRSLSHQPWRECVADHFPKRRVMSRGQVLAVALALASRWKRTIPSRRVGVVLPPGIGGMVANLALALAGKVPVNLNFTAGRDALESCFRRAEMDTVISAEALKKKLADFPWPERTFDVAAEIGACGKPAIVGWMVAAWCLPSSWLAAMAGVSAHGDHEEAGLLFTSGSSGEPKGVVLSHRNILGNVAQISATGIINHDDVLMGCLPLFHSFGFTVTLWYPLLQGVRVATLPSPLEVKKIADVVREEKATIFMGTPTFLRPYLRKTEPEALRSLRLIIAGAEKLPPELRADFLEKFGVPIFEGYGLTETSPVASVNLPDPPVTTSTAVSQPANRAGSVGRLLPGMTARIVDPDTGAERSLLEVGMLHLRGPNIFSGYLKDEERTHQVVKEGWFITGDLGRFDEDGFLFIEGRLSRFSKIGGEMVPHGTVEQKAIEALGLGGAETQPLAVVGVPDEAKGEALVVLTTVEIAPDQLREKLGAVGLPNLWIPRIIKRVEKIPTLASGKLDIKACEKIARGESLKP